MSAVDQDHRLFLPDIFSLTDQVAVVTGGYGTLGRIMAGGLAKAGAKVAILGRDQNKAAEQAKEKNSSSHENDASIAHV